MLLFVRHKSLIMRYCLIFILLFFQHLFVQAQLPDGLYGELTIDNSDQNVGIVSELAQDIYFYEIENKEELNRGDIVLHKC